MSCAAATIRSPIAAKVRCLASISPIWRPTVISGRVGLGTRTEGHVLFRCGDLYHYKSVRKLGPFALIRSYGYKLEIRYYQGPGRAAAVAIGRSLKRWKGPQ